MRTLHEWSRPLPPTTNLPRYRPAILDQTSEYKSQQTATSQPNQNHLSRTHLHDFIVLLGFSQDTHLPQPGATGIFLLSGYVLETPLSITL